MHQDTTWYGGRPRPRRHCVRWGPVPPLPKRGTPPIFGPRLLWPNGRLPQLLLSSCFVFLKNSVDYPFMFRRSLHSSRSATGFISFFSYANIIAYTQQQQFYVPVTWLVGWSLTSLFSTNTGNIIIIIITKR